MKGGLIGFIKHRKAVARWNFIKHEKIQYFESLNKVYMYYLTMNTLYIMIMHTQ